MSNLIIHKPLDNVQMSNNAAGDADYGERVHPVTHVKGTFHDGVDLVATGNKAVYAANTGEIIYAGWMEGYGNVVVIQEYFGKDEFNNDKYGQATMYAHLNDINVTKGYTFDNASQVANGFVIGHTGATGGVTGEHLHFEVLTEQAATRLRDWNVYKDPLGFKSSNLNPNCVRENPWEHLATNNEAVISNSDDKKVVNKTSIMDSMTQYIQKGANEVDVLIDNQTTKIKKGFNAVGNLLLDIVSDSKENAESFLNTTKPQENSTLSNFEWQVTNSVDGSQYTVKSGDTIAQLAQKYECTVNDILSNPNNQWLYDQDRVSTDGGYVLIKPGEQVYIPQADATGQMTTGEFHDWYESLINPSYLDNSLLDFRSEIAPGSNNTSKDEMAFLNGAGIHGGDWMALSPISVINGNGFQNEQMMKNVTDQWQPGDKTLTDNVLDSSINNFLNSYEIRLAA